MITFKYSNIGCREVNEDYVVSNDFGNGISLHLVADGMGGYDCGEIASKVVGDSYVYALSRNMDIEEATQVVSKNLQEEKHALGVKRMGSTVAGIFIRNMEGTVFWAGDSRVYIYRSGELLFQTEDHTVVNDLMKVRPLTFEERKRYSHVVTRSLMGDGGDIVEKKQLSLQADDEIIICSDGLYNDCPVDYILETIRSDKLDIKDHNSDFNDNHSLIYLKV